MCDKVKQREVLSMSKDEGIYIRCTHTKGDDMLVYQSTNKDVGFIVTSTELDENVAIMTDHAGVRKLRDYLNEILGEDQDTQPAAAPVAAGELVYQWFDGVGWRDCANTRDCFHIQASGFPIREMKGAPPVAAHGEEAATLAKALSLLWETTNFLLRGGSLDGRVSAFLAQHAPEPVASAAAAHGDETQC